MSEGGTQRRGFIKVPPLILGSYPALVKGGPLDMTPTGIYLVPLF